MLTTTAALKANYLNIDPLDTERDDVITACIEQACSIMKGTCNQPLEQETVDFYFTGFSTNANLSTQLLGGNGYATKTVPYTVPVQLSALYHRSLPTDAWAAESGATLFVSNLQNQIYTASGFGYNLYRAVLQVGYTTIPDELVYVASELAVYIWNETLVSNEGRAGLTSKAITQNNITTTRAFADVMKRMQPILSAYTVYPI